MAAFETGDAAAVAALRAAEGEYTPLGGDRLTGRAAIEKTFRTLPDGAKGLKVRVESESLRFLTPEVAVEEGVTFVLPPDGTPPPRPGSPTSTSRRPASGSWGVSGTPPTSRPGTGSTCAGWSGRRELGCRGTGPGRPTTRRSPGPTTRTSSSARSPRR